MPTRSKYGRRSALSELSFRLRVRDNHPNAFGWLPTIIRGQRGFVGERASSAKATPATKAPLVTFTPLDILSITIGASTPFLQRSA
jgi:hypothetical protein